MKLLDGWWAELTPAHRILDMGCGGGSFPHHFAGHNVIGIDVDFHSLTGPRAIPAVCTPSHTLPFAPATFDLVICHNSLEHISEVTATLLEIRRILKPTGRLFISVPDGTSLSDRLYRFLFCGGGHVQQFTFTDIQSRVESNTGLTLAGSQEQLSSFAFLQHRNFLPRPLGPLPGPFPRRMRWLSLLPTWLFNLTRLSLVLTTRAIDTLTRTHLSRYGWGILFSPHSTSITTEPACPNVCFSCGAAITHPTPTTNFTYHCPYCHTLNPLFS